MTRMDSARIKLQDAIAAIDALLATDHISYVDSIELNLLSKFSYHLVAMLRSINGEADGPTMPDSGMGRAIVDHWPRAENRRADVELNAVVRKVSEADYAYHRAMK